MTRSFTGGEGPGGGHEMRNARNLLESSELYMDEDRFGRSIKLHLGETTLYHYNHTANHKKKAMRESSMEIS